MGHPRAFIGVICRWSARDDCRLARYGQLERPHQPEKGSISGYRSEIRDSDILHLEDKVASGSYGTYLRRITLKRVRGFNDRVVSFDFPVTALVGLC